MWLINPLGDLIKKFHPLEVVSRYRDPQLKITHICFI